MDYFPSHIKDLEKIKPVFTELDGWTEDLRKVKCYSDLPRNAKAYIEAVQQLLGVHVSWIGTGPDRKEILQH